MDKRQRERARRQKQQQKEQRRVERAAHDRPTYRIFISQGEFRRRPVRLLREAHLS